MTDIVYECALAVNEDTRAWVMHVKPEPGDVYYPRGCQLIRIESTGESTARVEVIRGIRRLAEYWRY
jgi:hypothetical protein